MGFLVPPNWTLAIYKSVSLHDEALHVLEAQPASGIARFFPLAESGWTYNIPINLITGDHNSHSCSLIMGGIKRITWIKITIYCAISLPELEHWICKDPEVEEVWLQTFSLQGCLGLYRTRRVSSMHSRKPACIWIIYAPISCMCLRFAKCCWY